MDTRTCTHCKQEKPVSEFYARKGKSLISYNSWCKTCMMELDRATRRDRLKRDLLPVSPTEMMVIEKLQSLGIPAVPGKAMLHAFVDVIAWGCVGIEVKSSKLRKTGYSWSFTALEQTNLQGDIILLICNGDNPTFHLFNANHTGFYNEEGTRKGNISYSPNAKRHTVSLTHEAMTRTNDRWSLVEHCRLKFSDELKNGVRYPKWLRKTQGDTGEY